MNLLTWESGVGLNIVEWFNGAGGFWWYLLLPLHYLGTEIVVTMLLAVVYWCVSKRQGLRLMVLVLASQVVSNFLKLAWNRPRPFHTTPERIVNIDDSLQPGLPSGHTIFGTVLGLWIAESRRTVPAVVLGAALIVLMGVSRMVHGMHYPQDVGAGWVIGGLFFLLFIALEGGLTEAISISRKEGTLVRSTTIMGLGIALAALALAFVVETDFEGHKSILAPAGAIAGGIIGAALDAVGRHPFIVEAPVPRRLLRGLLGVASLAALSLILGWLFYLVAGESEKLPVLLLYLVRYALLGGAVTFLIPRGFGILRL